MKSILISLLIALIGQNMAFANAKVIGNGGDMCENRIKIIRDDIGSWIARGAASGLTLPVGVELEQYNEKMKAQVSKALIICTDSQIKLRDTEKTCKNFLDIDGEYKIICNNKRFMETSESNQYVLIHHEYAGLSGFEINDGAASDYSISNQISAYLIDQVVKKLAVKPAHNTYRLVVLGAGQISDFNTSLGTVDCKGIYGEGNSADRYKKITGGYQCMPGRNCSYAPEFKSILSINQYHYITKGIGSFARDRPYKNTIMTEQCIEDVSDKYSSLSGDQLSQLDSINRGLIKRKKTLGCYKEEAMLNVNRDTNEVRKIEIREVYISCP